MLSLQEKTGSVFLDSFKESRRAKHSFTKKKEKRDFKVKKPSMFSRMKSKVKNNFSSIFSESKKSNKNMDRIKEDLKDMSEKDLQSLNLKKVQPSTNVSNMPNNLEKEEGVSNIVDKFKLLFKNKEEKSKKRGQGFIKKAIKASKLDSSRDQVQQPNQNAPVKK
jgi:hypothetical protein